MGKLVMALKQNDTAQFNLELKTNGLQFLRGTVQVFALNPMVHFGAGVQMLQGDWEMELIQIDLIQQS
jgi:hypothetical protein